MADPNIVANMSEAVVARLRPAITRWNRLEGRPRTHAFDRALKAEVRDALWMLTRQWQMGEFQGDDAGSPVLARACIDLAPITRYQAGSGPAGQLDLDRPLEATVESRPLPLWAGTQYLSLDLRLLVGRRWLKLLAREAARPGGLSADYRDAYREQYEIPVPDPRRPADAAICAHPDVWQQVGAAAERAMDGIALLAHIAEPGGEAYDGVGAAGPDQGKLTALATRLSGWFADLILAPAAEGPDAWMPAQLEYQFGLSAPGFVMRAEEYSQGHLDWHALQRRPGQPGLDEPPPPEPVPERRVQTFLPTSMVFEGMPDTRWWAFEDRRTNFGEVRPDSTDLGKLLLLEFGLVYANDWFVLPFTVPIGTVVEVKGIAVSTGFGERFWIEPIRELPAEDWQRWSMFALTPDMAEPEPPAVRMIMLPTTPHLQQSGPVEEVVFIRDEMANMVWGIERRVPLPSGASRPGSETGREYGEQLQRLVGPAPPPPPPAAPIRYQVMNTVPEHWIPFIPARVEGSVRDIQLQRAALPRILEGAAGLPDRVYPRTTLLRHGLPRAYFVHEEEVPRAGAVVTQIYQRTRWIGGKVAVWFGASKQTGRGEGYSGLRFDGLAETSD